MKQFFWSLLILLSPLNAEELTLKQQLVRRPLSSIEMGKVSCDEIPFIDALHLLRLRIKGKTNDSIELQWVCMGFEAEEWQPTITITEERITAARFFSLVLQQAGLKARLESHAIVLRLPGEGKVVSKPVPKKPFKPRSTALEVKKLESSDYDRTPVKGRNPSKKSSREETE